MTGAAALKPTLAFRPSPGGGAKHRQEVRHKAKHPGNNRAVNLVAFMGKAVRLVDHPNAFLNISMLFGTALSGSSLPSISRET
jgi:hypothetical protein